MTTTKYSLSTIQGIPEVLADYLLKLIGEDRSICRIQLTPQTLGMGIVQEILCETESGSIMHRVFGFPPVKACLQIRHHNNQTEISMV